MRAKVNSHLKTEKMFAVWRIDPPWKSMCPRRQGKRMGGGKADISYYVTPVRAGRVILEVGGCIQFEEVVPFLSNIAGLLPFNAVAIDYDSLNSLRREYEELQAVNANPVSFKRAIERNLINCRAEYMSDVYDQMWFGRFE